MSHIKKLRYYQNEALKLIDEELNINNARKCLVKMFCGTGKSAIMRTFQVSQNVNLVVYVFPSLSLISQFTNDYLKNENQENILKISSDDNSTTEPYVIRNFLRQDFNKIICITYQSFATLIENLDDIIINICIFDEAHHAVGRTYQQLIFKDSEHSDKQIFFTATPKNANGITMYEKDVIGDCGKMVYDYTYYRGITEGYLNPFEIRLDFYTEHTNHSIYESICRSILASGNNRVLTFHSDVNTERDTSVNNFVNQLDLNQAFNKILNEEFPDKVGFYTKVKIIGLSSSIIATCSQCLEKIKKSIHRPINKSCCRYNILENFDKTKDNEILIISSCETIGEGIDTKNANNCVFVDPKSSYVSIMQNIGRIVRKNGERPLSTILIPCWVDREKYLNCNGDKEKCDEAIREDLGSQGNFNSILNVMSALRQEDEELYDICLHYPDKYSPQEIQTNLERQGFMMKDTIGDGMLLENVEHLLDEEIDYENYEELTDEETLMQIAEDYGVNVEIHTDSLEMPIEKYISSKDEDLEDESEEQETEKKIIRLYKTTDEETEETIYSPIVEKTKNGEKKKSLKNIEAPDRKKRMNVKVHTNPDIKVLWNIGSDFDGLKDMCSCVIECEIVDNWYERFDELNKFIDENNRRPSSESKNEYEKKLGCWFINQNKNYKKNKGSMKNQEKCNLWSQFLKKYEEYLKTVSEVWFKNLERTIVFIRDNKKKPSCQSKNKFEKYLASWINCQHINYKNKIKSMKDEIKYNSWRQFLKVHHEYLKTNNEIWYEAFEKLKQFINKNEKRPSQYAENKEEKYLANWIQYQNKNYKIKKVNMSDLKKYKLWTQFLECYEEYFKSDDDIWRETFEKLKQFMNENKKSPSQYAENKEEKYLGRWIQYQNKNYESKKHSMKDTEKYNLWKNFLKDYKEYFKSNDDIWYENFKELKLFIKLNKIKPSINSINKNEMMIAHWKNTQMSNYKNNEFSMKDKIKYKLWRHFLKENEEMFKTNDEKWYEIFKETKQFMNENKKRPNSKSKNIEETNLGIWIVTQNRNYKLKKGEIKDPEKYKLWTKFLIDYKDILNLKEDIIDYSINIEEVEESYEDVIIEEPEEELCFDNVIIETNNDEEEIHFTRKPKAIKKEIKEIEEKSEDKEEIKFIKKSVKLQRQKVWIRNDEEKNNEEDTQQQTTNIRQRTKTELQKYHSRYIVMRSDNLAQRFRTNRKEFIEYHSIRDQNLKTFDKSDRPHERIISELDKIKTKRQKLVVDMGCGLAKIAEYFKHDRRFEFINYDHVSTKENITECDISHTPLQDDSVEICIMSFALWGSNCEEYIIEAYRVLESGGKLYIIDSTKRWSDENEATGIIEEGMEGNRLKNILVEKSFQIINCNIDKWCLFVCEKV